LRSLFRADSSFSGGFGGGKEWRMLTVRLFNNHLTPRVKAGAEYLEEIMGLEDLWGRDRGASGGAAPPGQSWR
jgi:hypothetical protein